MINFTYWLDYMWSVRHHRLWKTCLSCWLRPWSLLTLCLSLIDWAEVLFLHSVSDYWMLSIGLWLFGFCLFYSQHFSIWPDLQVNVWCHSALSFLGILSMCFLLNASQNISLFLNTPGLCEMQEQSGEPDEPYFFQRGQTGILNLVEALQTQ